MPLWVAIFLAVMSVGLLAFALVATRVYQRSRRETWARLIALQQNELLLEERIVPWDGRYGALYGYPEWVEK